MHTNYAEMFNNIKSGKITSEKLEFTGTLEETLGFLKMYKNPEDIKLQVRSSNGYYLVLSVV